MYFSPEVFLEDEVDQPEQDQEGQHDHDQDDYSDEAQHLFLAFWFALRTGCYRPGSGPILISQMSGLAPIRSGRMLVPRPAVTNRLLPSSSIRPHA